MHASYSYSSARLDIRYRHERRQTDASPSIPCRVDVACLIYEALRTSLFERITGQARCLDCGEMDSFRVAPLDLHGRARRGLSRTVMRRVGLGLQVACLIGGRLAWLQWWLIGKGAWG